MTDQKYLDEIIMNSDIKFSKRAGALLRKIRQEKGMSIEQLGLRTGIHKQTISTMELGDSNINITKLDAICKTLNMTISEFTRPLN